MIYRIETPGGYLISRYEGTKTGARKFAKDHYTNAKVVPETKKWMKQWRIENRT